eukprot:COSAG02_NODE_51686_length_312_cov_1.103286_1_plen_23_part_10
MDLLSKLASATAFRNSVLKQFVV